MAMPVQRNINVYRLLMFMPKKNRNKIWVEYESRQSWSYHQGPYGYNGCYRKWCIKGEEVESCNILEKFAMGREDALEEPNLVESRGYLS